MHFIRNIPYLILFPAWAIMAPAVLFDSPFLPVVTTYTALLGLYSNFTKRYLLIFALTIFVFAAYSAGYALADSFIAVDFRRLLLWLFLVTGLIGLAGCQKQLLDAYTKYPSIVTLTFVVYAFFILYDFYSANFLFKPFILDNFHYQEDPDTFSYTLSDLWYRPKGLAKEQAAGAGSLLACYAFIWLITKKAPKVYLTVLLLVCQIMIGSSTFFVTAFLFLSYYLFKDLKKVLLILLVVIVTYSGSLFIGLNYGDQLVNKFMGGVSRDERLEYAWKASEMFLSFSVLEQLFGNPSGLQKTILRELSSGYHRILIELGVFGFSIFSLYLLAAVKNAYRASLELKTPMILGLLTFCFFFLTQSVYILANWFVFATIANYSVGSSQAMSRRILND